MSPLDSSKMTGSGLLTPANDHPTWVPDCPDSHSTSLVDYDVLAQWLPQHLPAADHLDVIFTGQSWSLEVHQEALATPLQSPRASLGTLTCLFVPLTSETGLTEAQCTWGGVFVAEAIAALRPTWHLLLSDTDVAPTALFELNELVDLCRHLMHEELSFGEHGILIGTDLIRTSTLVWPSLRAHKSPRPDSLWCKISAARRALLEKPREELPHRPAALIAPGDTH